MSANLSGATLDQLGFFEYHDTYSIYAALALEAAGFAQRGQGWKLAEEGAIARNGRIPCATMARPNIESTNSGIDSTRRKRAS